ncbi:TPM domain-containing protein [Silvibacterium acidisoli]|uniref:TPM domain-containing protein n=1 Tax=Acidobacteriaceae bacterium ZG23-2 TaxID=2883246 RepID=UPI00406CEDB5
MARFCAGLLVVASSLGASCESVKSLPRPTDYVSDFAHVMSPEAKQRINLLCGQVDRQAHAQIAVVTVHTTDDEPIEQYAVQLEDAWGVGPKKTDRGVIVLLAVNDRKRFIATGYGLESILPDGLVGQIGRQMVPYLRQNDFDGAISTAVGQMSQIIARDAGVTLSTAPRRGPPQGQPVHLSLGQLLLGAIFIIFLLIFLARFGGSGIIGFLLGMFLGGGGRGGGGWGGGGGGDDGGSGFGGFGGGSTGGGGAGGDW